MQVSADDDNPTATAPLFANINPTYASIFHTFSPQRLFSPIGSNIVDLTFFVPGTTTPAVTRGFGAVYTDVDDVGNTAFEYFDAAGQSLGTFSTPVSDNGLSFWESPFLIRSSAESALNMERRRSVRMTGMASMWPSWTILFTGSRSRCRSQRWAC